MKQNRLEERIKIMVLFLIAMSTLGFLGCISSKSKGRDSVGKFFQKRQAQNVPTDNVTLIGQSRVPPST